jgi:hypothetical protein
MKIRLRLSGSRQPAAEGERGSGATLDSTSAGQPAYPVMVTRSPCLITCLAERLHPPGEPRSRGRTSAERVGRLRYGEVEVGQEPVVFE